MESNNKTELGAARAKAAALVTAHRNKERRRRILLISGAGVAVAVVVAGVVIGVNASHQAPASAAGDARAASTSSTQAPPWAAPLDASARAKAAGLTMLTAEGTAEHIHTHLSITADGKAIAVPGDIGIDLNAELISPLHTHDATGIVHVESPVVKKFTLGEVFTEWNVALNSNRVGSYSVSGGYTLTTFVNGKKSSSDPSSIQLANHEDIDMVITRGTETATAPAPFTWPAGY